MKKKIIIISIIFVFILSIFTLIYFSYYNPFLSIKLVGEKEITIDVNSKYKEKGVEVKGTKNKYIISGKVNTKKLGTYTLTYKIRQINTRRSVKRKIKVVDKEKPVIELKGEDVTIYVDEEYKEPGYSATDNYDGDITDKVSVNSNLDNKKVGEYLITYDVSDSSGNTFSISRKVIVKEKIVIKTVSNNTSGITYIKGILLVNKKYSLPSNYNPGVDPTANKALINLQNDASLLGYNLSLKSGFRSYYTQKSLYNYYVSVDGEALASTYSAKPGQSEHQTGLAFDVGEIDDNFGNTPSGIWLAENCHRYGFIIRYLKGKENITGYKYEPWHIRYVGVDVATSIYNSKITLEEYLGVN